MIKVKYVDQPKAVETVREVPVFVDVEVRIETRHEVPVDVVKHIDKEVPYEVIREVPVEVVHERSQSLPETHVDNLDMRTYLMSERERSTRCAPAPAPAPPAEAILRRKGGWSGAAKAPNVPSRPPSGARRLKT